MKESLNYLEKNSNVIGKEEINKFILTIFWVIEK